MCNCVFDKQMLELVDGSVSKPGLSDLNLLKIWEAKNAKVLLLINEFVDPAIKKRLAAFKSSKEAWNYLARLYAHSTLAENYRFEIEMRAISQGDRTIEELRDILVGYWDKLAVMEPKDLSSLDSFKKYRGEHQLVQLLVALRDDFEPLRRSILQRSTFPSVQEAVEDLVTEEGRLKKLNVPPPQAQLEKLSINQPFDRQVAKNRCTHCHQTGHSMLNCPETLKNDRNKIIVKSHGSYGESSSLTPDTDDMHSYIMGAHTQVLYDAFGESPLENGCYLPPSKNYSGCYQSSNTKPIQRSPKYHQPVLQLSSETSRPAASHLTPDNEDGQPILSRDMFRSAVKLVAHVHSDFFGESPSESACYLSDSDEEDYDRGTALSTLKILSYNVWFWENVEVHKRMESIGNLIRLHSPDVICFQEVTPNIFGIF
ncbi:hypothetical protein Ddye_019710 [Dipteronia dyeriana]|uniref:CCHC-type domain-containing protein n=1 Tax=Dipteronia dyeriana TaxID=168575 RepID=A0AAD9TZF2_9ROSI|nr:hypothetical protein Ddye_019710 [Dipteronia dyeriana]